MPRGGRRQGRPGTGYQNRSDLNAPKPKIQVAPGQQYGQGVAQLQAQQAVPVAPPPNRQPIEHYTAAESAAASFQFPDLSPINAESEFPDEPVTAGLDMGTGPGREILGLPDNSLEGALRAIYKAEPSEPLREIIEELERRG